MDKILGIIIPSYNMEAYLAKGLDSVLSIDNPSPLDVIVVNDGSKDGTLEIARSYATRFPGIVNVIDKENGHYGSCINAGLKIAQGKYVRILDADDSFYTDEFEEFVRFLETTDADLIVNDYKKEYINGNAVEYTYDLPRNKIVSFCDYVASDTISEILLPAVTYRLGLIRDIGYRQLEGMPYTDTQWVFMPILNVRTLAYFDKPVYRYLIGREGQSVSSEVFKKSLAVRYSVYSALVDNYVESGATGLYKEFAVRQLAKHAMGHYKTQLVDNPRLDRTLLYKLDDELKIKVPEAYTLCGISEYRLHLPYKYVADWRKTRCENIPLYVRIAGGILDSIGKMRLKIKKIL